MKETAYPTKLKKPFFKSVRMFEIVFLNNNFNEKKIHNRRSYFNI